MATAQSTLGAISNDATWRAYVQFIHDILLAAGFVQTADTGQVTIGSQARPSTGIGNAVYEIWRFDDALQATAPIFFKLWYGCSPSGQHYFGLWMQIGKGSDGSGNITDEVLPQQQFVQGQPSAANTVSVASGKDGAWINVLCAAYLSTNGNYHNSWCGFSLERSKNADGDDTADGILIYLFTYGSGSVNNQKNIYCRYSDGSYWIDWIGGAQLPFNQTSGAGPDAKTAVYPNYVFSSGRTEFPGKNLAAGFTANFATLSNYTVQLYGQNVTMRSFPNATSDTLQFLFRKHSVYTHGTHSILMRWE